MRQNLRFLAFVLLFAAAVIVSLLIILRDHHQAPSSTYPSTTPHNTQPATSLTTPPSPEHPQLQSPPDDADGTNPPSIEGPVISGHVYSALTGCPLTTFEVALIGEERHYTTDPDLLAGLDLLGYNSPHAIEWQHFEDETGYFELTGVDNDTIWSIGARAEAYAPQSALIQVPLQGNPAPIAIHLNQGGAVSGHVRDTSGHPIFNAGILLGPELGRTSSSSADGKSENPIPRESTTRTDIYEYGPDFVSALGLAHGTVDDDGHFEFADIEPGTHTVLAVALPEGNRPSKQDEAEFLRSLPIVSRVVTLNEGDQIELNLSLH